MKKLTIKDFAFLFGTNVKDISSECRKLISKSDFSYKELEGEERDKIILDVLKNIEMAQFSIAGKKKQMRWEKGWQDILNRFMNSGYDASQLKPHYDLKPARFIRLYQDYVVPKDPMFEMKWLEIFRVWLFRKYLSRADAIYEFGCGTGQNLVTLANLFPEKKLYGSEWVNPPIRIIKLLAQKYGYNIEGKIFDLFSPNYDMHFAPNSMVLTRAALEQTGQNFEKFLTFLLKKRPALCLHTEPIVELYDENNLPDYLAIKFQRRRNYLDGFLNRLRELENAGRIEILKIHRIPLGSLYLDPYSYIVWRPRR